MRTAFIEMPESGKERIADPGLKRGDDVMLQGKAILGITPIVPCPQGIQQNDRKTGHMARLPRDM